MIQYINYTGPKYTGDIKTTIWEKKAIADFFPEEKAT